jgi:tetratricopeptide (TPR) repeat protein
VSGTGYRISLIRMLRLLYGCSVADVMRRSGLGRVVYRYDEGEIEPPEAAVAAIAQGLGISSKVVEEVRLLVDCWNYADPIAAGEGVFPQEVVRGVGEDLLRSLHRVGPLILLYSEALPEVDDAEDPERARTVARSGWQRLKALSLDDLAFVVTKTREFRTWAFCELLCERSEQAAGDKPAAAIDLGRLAVEIAQQVEGDPRSRSRLEGFARAHLANAQRAASDLDGSAREMEQGLRLWRIGDGSLLGGVLDESRVLDLEASLRRAQRQFGKALALIQTALEVARPGGRGRLLLKKWKIFEQMGDADEMLAVIEEARQEIDEQNPHLLFAQRFNHAVTLQLLGRMSEAAILLAEARGLAIANDRQIELVRVTWQEGRVAESLGHRQKAIELTTRARDGFLEARNAYDAALTSLDLAMLYLSDGQKREVRRLAREMLPIFRTLGVHQEAAAAVLVFIKAVEADRISRDQVRGIIDFLEHARHNPSLRFRRRSGDSRHAG